MIKINDNFCELPASYLFSDVAKRINAFKAEHPDVEIIKMGIGDVTQPICPQPSRQWKTLLPTRLIA